jgi:hypothetical protein
MVFLGSLAGSNTVSVDSLTTTGLVTTPALRIGPVTTVNEVLNHIWYGLTGGIAGVTDTGMTLTTVTVPGMVSSDLIFVTAYFTGTPSPLPSIYARVYDSTTGSFRVALRVDNETPGTFNVSFHWIVLN